MKDNNANYKDTSSSSTENSCTEEKYVADDTGFKPCESLYDVIIHHYPMIKREIEPRFLLDKLIQESIIDEDRAEHIRTTSYRKTRVDILLYSIIRQPENILTKFIKVLIDDYAYLAKQLSTTGQRRRDVQAPSDTKGNLENHLLKHREEIMSEMMQMIQDEVLDDFLQAFVFNVEDHEEVTSGEFTRRRAEIFFRILLRTLPHSYQVLCECLKARDKIYLLDILSNRTKTAGEQTENTKKEKSQNEVCRKMNLKLTNGEMICTTAGSQSASPNLKLTIEFDSQTTGDIEIKIVERVKETKPEAVAFMRSSILGSNLGSVVIYLKPESRNVQLDLRRCITHGFLDKYIKSLLQKEGIIDHFTPGDYDLKITIAEDDNMSFVCERPVKALEETKETPNCIKLNRSLLMEEIEPLELVPLMKKKGIKIFDDIHFEYITSRQQRADRFLNCIEAGENEVLDAFLDVLCDVGLNELHQILFMTIQNRRSEILAIREKIFDNFPEMVNVIEPKALHSVFREDITFSSDFVGTISDASKSRRERCIEFLEGILRSDDHVLSGLIEALKSSGHAELASNFETPRFDDETMLKYNFVKTRHMHGENGVIFKGAMVLTVSEDIVKAVYRLKHDTTVMEDKCMQVGVPNIGEELQNSEIIETLKLLHTEQTCLNYLIEHGRNDRQKHKNLRQAQTSDSVQWQPSFHTSTNKTKKSEEDGEDWESRYESLKSDLESVESEIYRIEELKDEELIQSSQIISKQYGLIVRLYVENLNSKRKFYSVLDKNVNMTNQLNKLKTQLEALGGNPDEF